MKDYTNYDYQALVDRMTELLANKDGWGDAYQSSMGQTLIQLMADTTDQLHYMLERRTTENFINLARLRSSIFARASDLGYRPFRVRGHSGYLQVQIVDDDGEPLPVTGEVNLAAMKQITYEGRTFYVTEPAYVQQGQTTAIFKVKEGTLLTEEFDLTLGEEPIFPVYENIEEDIFFVYNNGEEYFDVRKASDVNKRALSFLTATDAYYDIKYGVDGMRIVFGDNNFGKQPTGIVNVYYSQVNDVGDAILSLGNEFEFAAPLTDYQNPSIEYQYVLTNVSPIVGGEVAESTEEIRTNATAYHRSNGRAVTNEDYAFWMKEAGISDIVDSKAFGEEEFDSLIYNANNVYLTYATSTGSALTVQEKQAFIDYFDQIKTSQAHVVFNQANNVFLRLITDVVKNKNVPISNAQAYSIIRNFIIEYTKIKKGSIGGHFQLSDMIDAMYDLKFNRHGVTYDLIDYVKLSSDVAIPFDFPANTNEAFVEIDPMYTPMDGDQFVLNIDNLSCVTTVNSSDNFQDILQNMRDVIRELTPFAAIVQLSGVALDAFGNPLPIEVNPLVGYHLLIGADTPYLSPTEVVAPAIIGSAAIAVQITSPAFEVNHYYYSTPAGRRPMIPLRVGTEVTFTAPTDTDVKVYTRTNARDASTETFMMDLLAGETFNEISTDEHVYIFEYVNNSVEDVIANIKYPDYSGVKYGLKISALDNFGRFDIRTTGGDLEDYISVDYRIQLPISDFYDVSTDTAVLSGSFRIADTAGNVLYRDDGSGRFLDNTGAYVPSGTIDYKSGIVTLPKTLPAVIPPEKYMILYDQDRFENIRVSGSEVIKLIEPPTTAESTVFSLSQLRVS